jgi:hypothetical protein
MLNTPPDTPACSASSGAFSLWRIAELECVTAGACADDRMRETGRPADLWQSSPTACRRRDLPVVGVPQQDKLVPAGGMDFAVLLEGLVAEARRRRRGRVVVYFADLVKTKVRGMILELADSAALTDRNTRYPLLLLGFETTTSLIGNGVMALLRGRTSWRDCARTRAWHRPMWRNSCATTRRCNDEPGGGARNGAGGTNRRAHS